MRLVLASRNEHKLRELRDLLPDWDVRPLDADDYPEEAGATFYENALAKARFARTAAQPHDWVVGEDSGLEVEGLQGRPGIRSARYAGVDATDQGNVARLLEELTGVSEEGRRARYVSELVALSPDDEQWRGSGVLTGHIAGEARGTGGFGYDPVFLPEGEELTVAELGDAWKRRHSHRARAAFALVEAFRRAGAGL